MSSITFAVGDVGGTVKVRGGVPGASDAVVLPKLRLVGSGWAADTAVGTGVVVMSRSAVHWGETGRSQCTYCANRMKINTSIDGSANMAAIAPVDSSFITSGGFASSSSGREHRC